MSRPTFSIQAISKTTCPTFALFCQNRIRKLYVMFDKSRCVAFHSFSMLSNSTQLVASICSSHRAFLRLRVITSGPEGSYWLDEYFRRTCLWRLFCLHFSFASNLFAHMFIFFYNTHAFLLFMGFPFHPVHHKSCTKCKNFNLSRLSPRGSKWSKNNFFRRMY